MKKNSNINSKKKEFKQKSKIDLNSVKDLRSFMNYVFRGEDFMSHILYFVILFILFKYLLIPAIGFLMGTTYPLTAIVSASMEHDLQGEFVCGNDFTYSNQNYWDICGDYYETNLDISQNQFSLFPYVNGMYRGDVIIVYGRPAKLIEVGDVVLFKGQDKVLLENGEEESLFFLNYGPIIHRVVEKSYENETYYFTTKGDNNPAIMQKEVNIPQDDILGVAVLRIPYLGLINYYFYNYIIAPLQ